MPMPIQDEPESTVGRKPPAPETPERPEDVRTGSRARSGASIRREEGDESEFAGEIRERERDEPPVSDVD